MRNPNLPPLTSDPSALWLGGLAASRRNGGIKINTLHRLK